jgi:hypothetical protein
MENLIRIIDSYVPVRLEVWHLFFSTGFEFDFCLFVEEE